MRVPHPGSKSTNLLKSLPMGLQAVCHPGTRLPQKLHSSSAPARKPRVRAVQDVITQYIAGYISLLCSVVVVPFLFYCIYLISSRSSGPKHTRIREIIFHWLYRLLKHSTVGGNFDITPCHTAVLSPDITPGLFRSSHQRIQRIDRVQHSTV